MRTSAHTVLLVLLLLAAVPYIRATRKHLGKEAYWLYAFMSPLRPAILLLVLWLFKPPKSSQLAGNINEMAFFSLVLFFCSVFSGHADVPDGELQRG